MDILEAKNIVIKAGHELLKAGLIVRTWGNISCRISDTQFVITPSGKAYDTLTPDDIVLVNIADLSYDGDVKPSSEKGIHASCYELRPDINFVIHTHQKNASVVSTLGLDINNITGEEAEIIGTDVPCATYGLPGQPKLREGVINALKRSTSKAAIMKHHGAVCLGTDYEDAFAVANALENVCEKFIVERCCEVSGKAVETFSGVVDYVTEVFKSDSKYKAAKEFVPCDSTRKGDCFFIGEKDKQCAIIDTKSGALIGGGEIPDSADMHWAIYKKRKDVNYIRHTKDENVVAMSRKGKTMKPFLDDLAQLCGPVVKCAVFNPSDTLKTSKKVVKALGKRNAVLIKDNGAVCVAGNQYDAEAVEIVMEKGCKTAVGAELYAETKPIGAFDAHLMNFIYKVKYSKKAGK
ncbi:MAG: class II aldolase/adducin family protein [Clostridia bacterium]|nr:class II aldolase/adducin family protein [Clostridia bacterium]